MYKNALRMVKIIVNNEYAGKKVPSPFEKLPTLKL